MRTILLLLYAALLVGCSGSDETPVDAAPGGGGMRRPGMAGQGGDVDGGLVAAADAAPAIPPDAAPVTTVDARPADVGPRVLPMCAVTAFPATLCPSGWRSPEGAVCYRCTEGPTGPALASPCRLRGMNMCGEPENCVLSCDECPVRSGGCGSRDGGMP